ncbi:MAG: LamG-like jellyroll fold domain-containing protein [Planctomycetota bacterium]
MRRHRKSRLETLENRRLLAGSLTVDVTDLPPALLSTNPGIVSAVADDGIDDAPAIQAAVDYLSTELTAGNIDSATLRLPTGVFHLGESLKVNAGLTIEGDGPDRTTLTHAASLSFDGQDVTDQEVQLGSVNRAGYLIDLDRDADSTSVSDITLAGPEMLGGLFAARADNLLVENVRFESFVWSGLRTFNIDGLNVKDSVFVDAGGRRIREDGSLAGTGGGIFSTFTINAEISNNHFYRSGESDVNFFGIKGRKWTDSRIHHNTIDTNFAIELPFENDRNVEIDHNFLDGVVSVPKFAGGPEFELGESFHVHHNYFTRSYSIEGARNGLLVENNVFEFDVNNDGGNLIANFGSAPVPGALSFTNNLVVNPGRGLLFSNGVHDDIRFTYNTIISNQTISPRDEGLLGIKDDDRDGNETDFNTVEFSNNIVEFNGIARPLFRNDSSYGSSIFNNSITNASDTDRYDNPSDGTPQGVQTSLMFDVGVNGEFAIDGDAIAQAARNAVQPVAADSDQDGIQDNFDPSPADATNGLGTLLGPGQTLGTDFSFEDGTSPLSPETGLTGINISPDAYPTFYTSDIYGVLSSPEAAIHNGRLQLMTNNGDSFNDQNENADGYGLMINTGSTEKFTVTSTVIVPDDGLPQAGGAAIGVQIGDGSQESYIKLTRTFGGGENRFEVRWDDSDALQDAAPGSSATRQLLSMSAEQAAAPAYQLSLDVNRSDPDQVLITPTAQPLDAEGNPVGQAITGAEFRVTGAVANAINGLNDSLPGGEEGSIGGLFVGVYSTDYSGDFNRVPSFLARWENLQVISNDPLPANVSLSSESDTGLSSSDAITSLNNATPQTTLSFDVSGVKAGDRVELTVGETLVGSRLVSDDVEESDTISIITNGQTELLEGENQVTVRRIVPGFVNAAVSEPISIVVDTVAPTVSLPALPGGVALEILDLAFSEPVSDVALSDLQLTIDGLATSLSDAALQRISNRTFSLFDLGEQTNSEGLYELDWVDGGSPTDLAGNTALPINFSSNLVTPVRSFNKRNQDYWVVPHSDNLVGDSGAIEISFSTNDLRSGTLFSKDHRDFGNGGHLTIKIRNGRIEVRLQSTDSSHYVRGGELAKGVDHDLRLEYGQSGLKLFFDGELVDSDDYDGGTTMNVEDIVIGASKIRSAQGQNDRLRSFLTGRINRVRMFDASGEIAFSEAVTEYDITDESNRFNGVDQFVEFEHTEAMELASGSISLEFNTDDASKRQTLFSKDNRGYDDGGHLTTRIIDGRIEVRLQSESESYYVRSQPIESGVDYRVTVRFGDGGLKLFLNGQLVDEEDYEGNIMANKNALILGASQVRSSDASDRLEDYFQGTLGGLIVMDGDGNIIDLSPDENDTWVD